MAVKDRIFTGECAELFFTEKGKFIPALLSASIQHEFHIITMKDSREIWIYREEGYYESNGAEELRRIVKQILGEKYRENYAQATIDDITASTGKNRKELNSPLHLIAVKNGILNISESVCFHLTTLFKVVENLPNNSTAEKFSSPFIAL